MTRARFEPTDTLPVVEQKLDANAEKNENLQTAVGLADNATTLGTDQGLAGAVAASDTVLVRLRKLQELGGGGSSLALNDLGADFSLTEDVTGSVRGTTYINETSVESAGYPITADGLWNLDIKVSSAIASNSFGAGALVDYLAVRRADDGSTRAYVTTGVLSGGIVTLDKWVQIGGEAPNLTTQNNLQRTNLSTAANEDFRRLLAGGHYTVVVNSAAAAASARAPYVPPGDESITWHVHVIRTASLTGRVEAQAFYSDRGAEPAQHTWYANATLANSTDILWQGLNWRYLGQGSPVNPEAGPVRQKAAVNEFWIRIGQSNAVGVDHLKEDGFNQDPLEPFGADAPHPKVLDISDATIANFSGSFNPTPRGERGELVMMTRAADAGNNTTSFAQQFGKSRVEAHPEIERLAIMCRAVGGTAMSRWKGPDGGTSAGDLFSAVLADAVQFLRNNPEFTPAGIIWHQGESDVGRPQQDYEDDVLLMVNGLRQLVPGGENMVFIAGTMTKAWRDVQTGSNTVELKGLIHQAHLRTPQYISNSAVAVLDDLVVVPNEGTVPSEPASDVIHYGREHLREIGRRYAALAEGLVDCRQNLNAPRYDFKYDPTTEKFINVANPGVGQIYGQRFVNDPDRGLVLDCRTSNVAPFTSTNLEYEGFHTDWVFNPREYTKALWVRLKGTVGNGMSFMSHGNNTANKAILMTVNIIDHGNFQAAGAGGNSFASDIVSDTWVHLAVTFDGTNFQKYVNGVASDPAFAPSTLSPEFDLDVFGLIQLGKWETGAGQQWAGLIDRPFAQSSALTVNEIAALYAAQS